MHMFIILKIFPAQFKKLKISPFSHLSRFFRLHFIHQFHYTVRATVYYSYKAIRSFVPFLGGRDKNVFTRKLPSIHSTFLRSCLFNRKTDRSVKIPPWETQKVRFAKCFTHSPAGNPKIKIFKNVYTFLHEKPRR